MKFTLTHSSHSTKHRLALPKHSFLHKIGRDFVVDWLVMLSLGAFLTLLFVGIGYIKYLSSEKVIYTETQVALPSSIVHFDDARLDTTLEAYDAKQKVRASLQAGQFTIPDPGL